MTAAYRQVNIKSAGGAEFCRLPTAPQAVANPAGRLGGRYFSHRFPAAFLAISAFRSGVRAFALAAPPSFPSCCAGLGAGASSRSSGSSPVAIRMTRTAAPITSAGRFSPRGPLGIMQPPVRVGEWFQLDRQSMPFRALYRATSGPCRRQVTEQSKRFPAFHKPWRFLLLRP